MPKVQRSVFSLQSSAKIRLKKISTAVNSYFNSDSSQQGVAQLALVLLLIAGVAVGTYVVQNRTNISPNAQGISRGQCDGSWEFIGNKDDESGESDNAGDESQWRENSPNCSSNNDNNGQKCEEEKWTDEVTSGESSCRDGKVCYKAWKRNSDCSISNEGWACSDRSCNGNTQENSDRSEEDCKKAGGTWRDNRCFTASSSSGGTTAPGNNPPATTGNTQYDQGECRDGAQSYKDGYAWIAYCSVSCTQNSDCPQNTSDGAVDPKTSNWCYGFNGGQAPRCMKLVQTDNKEVNDQNRKTTNTQAVQTIKQTIAQGGNPNPATQSPTISTSVDLKAKVDAQNKQRNDLVNELATIINLGASGNSALSASVNRAQSLITAATAFATTCYTGTDKPLNDSCDAQAQAANDVAVAASRVALFDAVAAGIPNTCVKVDMAVGSNTSNSIIEVNPSGSTNLSRLFMCRGAETTTGAKDGDIKWRVRDDKGGLGEVSAESLTKLGLKNNIKSISEIPQDYVTRRNNAATLAGLSAYNASTLNFSVTDPNAWKEVPVSNCLNNCSSFPSGSTCYQKGTTNQYNCNGQSVGTPTTTTNTPQTTTEKKNLAKGATCSKNSECKGGQCNPGTSKCN